MADAADVMARIRRRPGVRYPVLTPNMKGFDAALAAKADEVAVFVAASRDVFAQEHQLQHRREPRARRGRSSPRRRRTACACAATSRACSAARTRATSIRARWREIAAALFALGAYEVSLGDTIGVGTAGKTGGAVRARGGARAGRGARRPFPRHLRPGADQRLRGDGNGRGHVRLLGRGSGRLSVREGRDRQRRERGRRLPAGRPRHRHRRRPDEAPRRRAGDLRFPRAAARPRASRARWPRRSPHAAASAIETRRDARPRERRSRRTDASRRRASACA